MAATDQDLLEDKIQKVRRQDRRFSRNAYYFVLDALDYTMTHFGRDQLTGEDRHVGGRELCWALRDYALLRWGLLARVVLESWNIKSSSDFGRIVFGFIDFDMMRKQDDDSESGE